MVKNISGGSNHKKFGRKHTISTKTNRLRISEDIGELYAIVSKMLGNGMFHCCCLDGTTRLGHIRGKFSGRGKRDNMVEIGKWILVGLREWDINTSTCVITSKSNKYQQCDLLEVYQDSDKQRLKETIAVDWSILELNDVSKTHNKDVYADIDGLVFATARDLDRERLINEMNTNTTTIKLVLEEIKEEDDEINIDDI
jgi:initiation factor 1A